MRSTQIFSLVHEASSPATHLVLGTRRPQRPERAAWLSSLPSKARGALTSLSSLFLLIPWRHTTLLRQLLLCVGCHAHLQGIFPTQGSNPGLPHCRRIIYCLNHQESPGTWLDVFKWLKPLVKNKKCILEYYMEKAMAPHSSTLA